MKCILTSLTFHILTLGSVLIEQGGYICYLVSSGAKNSEADLIYSFANILTKSKRYIDYIVGGTKCNVYACPHVKYYENWLRFGYPIRVSKITHKTETLLKEKAHGSSWIINETHKILISKV